MLIVNVFFLISKYTKHKKIFICINYIIISKAKIDKWLIQNNKCIAFLTQIQIIKNMTQTPYAIKGYVLQNDEGEIIVHSINDIK